MATWLFFLMTDPKLIHTKNLSPRPERFRARALAQADTPARDPPGALCATCGSPLGGVEGRSPRNFWGLAGSCRQEIALFYLYLLNPLGW